MKNKISSSHSVVNTKPINHKHLEAVSASNPNVKKESIFDKIKHGLKETGDFVKDHTIGEVEKAAHAIDHKAKDIAHTIKTDAISAAHTIGSGIKSGASDLLHGAEAVESGLLPSGSSILMESGLAVGGLAIVAILVLKFF